MSIESVVFCEGFHDRAFWKGLLLRLGCTDPGIPPPGTPTRLEVSDPWGGKVTRGRFAFLTPTQHFIQIIPCGGKTNIIPLVRQRLRKHATEPVRRIIINEDEDLPAGAAPGTATPASVEAVVKDFDPAAAQSAVGEWELYGGTVGVSLVLWRAADPQTDGVPTIQTLERLVAAAICAAHVGRGAAVKNWLDSRPLPPAPDVKDFSWSHMAGWYAVMGGETFYSNLWNEPAIATELENRLQGNGTWALIQAFAQ